MNLLQPDAYVGKGAAYSTAGIEVSRPWGFIDLTRCAIEAGWYCLSAKAASPFCLQLYEPEACSLVELVVRSGEPVYIRLNAGAYHMRLIAGGRPAEYRIEAANFQRLTLYALLVLLGGRFYQALRAGTSARRILDLIQLAFQRRYTFGVQARKSASPQAVGGPFACDDWDQHGSAPSRGQTGDLFAARLAAMRDGPVFYIAPNAPAGLESQAYRNFTTERTQRHDFTLVTDLEDALTADALLLFAEAARRNPSAKVILADVWHSGQPTARVAWDPWLYEDGPPTPFAVAADMPLEGLARLEPNQCAVIAIPISRRASLKLVEATQPSATPPAPMCSIIVPTRDRADLLEACLESLYRFTRGAYEVVIVDNGSVEPETFAVFDRYCAKGARVLRVEIPFNFSDLCNRGAAVASGDFLLFLNNDVVLYEPDWLEQMMRCAMRPEVGAVGAKLYYADGRLQHGGVTIGLTEACGHLWRGATPDAARSEPRLQRNSLRAAVTAACLCVAKAKFSAVDGFDAQCFPVTLNDVDLCLRLQQKGWLTVFCAAAQAFHMEGESRGIDASPDKLARRRAELAAFSKRWGEYIDPWLSLAVTRANESGLPR